MFRVNKNKSKRETAKKTDFNDASIFTENDFNDVSMFTEDDFNDVSMYT